MEKRKKRFFMSAFDEKEGVFLIKDNEFNHLKNVLRLNVSDEVFGISEVGIEYKSEIIEIIIKTN